MSVAEIQEQASSLPQSEQAELAAFLLDSLSQGNHEVSDDEALRRRDDLISGKVKAMNRDEFTAACGH